MFWSLMAHAQEAAATAPAATGEGPSALMSQGVPLIVLMGVMYFLFIRPHSKRQRETQQMLTALKSGDEVLTNGGILGRIEGLTEQFVTLEISPNVRIKVLRAAIAGKPQNAAKKGN